MANETGVTKDLRIYDRDGRPVSQGAFNAMQDAYGRMGEKVKDLQRELNAALDVIEEVQSMARRTDFNPILRADLRELLGRWERRETRRGAVETTGVGRRNARAG